jgi:hypothetical protein
MVEGGAGPGRRPGPRAVLLGALVLPLLLGGVAVARLSSCDGPAVITRGGTYSGCWSSADAGTVTVRVATSEPVILTNCTIRGRFILVASTVAHTKLTITDCRLVGTGPGAVGAHPDYAVEVDGFDRLHVEHSRIEGKGGIKAKHWSGVPSQHPVLVRANQARNIDGRVRDAAERVTGAEKLQFVQLDKVRGAAGVEIAWNEVRNQPGRSAVEDNISIYASGGTPVSPIDIHDNYVEGGWPPDPAAGGYSGGGILLGDGGGEWSVARDNQVVATSNHGLGIAGGSHNRLVGNRAVASGELPDGRRAASQNVGVYVWDQTRTATAGAASDNAAYGNVVGWQRGDGRNDWWLPDCSGSCANQRLHDGHRITPADEAAERERWRAKLARAKVRPGPREASWLGWLGWPWLGSLGRGDSRSGETGAPVSRPSPRPPGSAGAGRARSRARSRTAPAARARRPRAARR